ncbi:DJ-1/PfpI family protein [Streptomyces diastatochromogenes]|uniref:Thiamine biosynthesis protein ThiJ n=1 Tax=Streptomyces diastatochromogenes TaxID=42236 RepID=A0A233SB87_STRDA|nr:DJ-1/PfpI family protein [Streptomyces diastatochromogenes]MCZ0985282.1 DJ-1/PfpI family protein [Streptomyces diastatochromogenes]OXY92892.1 thiamine biosynthesis protein ThiJ [Streptomyces diastatochromogenes]
MTDTLTIGVLLFDDVEELDVVGPWEVLGFWASHIASSPVQLLAVGPDAGAVVVCSKGLRLVADCGTNTAPPLDVLVHPGGNGTRTLVRDEGHLHWLRSLHERGTVLASVCTGSLVLAAAGLLAGRPATTHQHYLDKLTTIDGTVDVRAWERYVDDGDIVSSAGVSAGIDMALHLVTRFGGAEASAATCAGIQYEAPAGKGV